MHVDERKLQRFLVDADLADPEVLKTAVEEAKSKGRSSRDAILSSGALSADDLRRVEAHLLGVPFVHFAGIKFDPGVLALVPEPVSRSRNIIAFKRSGDTVEIAMLDPQDLESVEFLNTERGLKLAPRLTDSQSMKYALLAYQKALKSQLGDTIRNGLKSVKDSDDQSSVEAVDALLKHALVQDVSDMHIEPAENQTFIRYRIRGILYDAMVLPRDAGAGLVAHIKDLAGLNASASSVPQNGGFKARSAGEEVSFRVSTMPFLHGEKAVVSIARGARTGFSLETLGFAGQGLESLHRTLSGNSGMIVVAGQKGSGRTTTLYTMLDMLNAPARSISTIEDPVEFGLPRVSQAQVRPELGVTFASGLRSILRQDPDIVMVGDLRDAETLGIAAAAASHGKMVLASMSVSTVGSTVERLLGMGLEPLALVSILKVAVSQRLVPRLPGEPEKYYLNKDEIASLGNIVSLDRMIGIIRAEKVVREKDGWDKVPFWRPAPVSVEESQVNGHVAIQEVLNISPVIKELIISGASPRELEERAREEGMHTMLEDGILKAAQGQVSLEDVLKIARA